MSTFNVQWIYDTHSAGHVALGEFNTGYHFSAVENRPVRGCATPGDHRSPFDPELQTLWDGSPNILMWNYVSGGGPRNSQGEFIDRDGDVYNRDVSSFCSFTSSGFTPGSDAAGTFSFDDSQTTLPILGSPSFWFSGTPIYVIEHRESEADPFTYHLWYMIGYTFGVAEYLPTQYGERPKMFFGAIVDSDASATISLQWRPATSGGYSGLTRVQFRAGGRLYDPSYTIAEGIYSASLSLPINSDNIWIRLVDAYGNFTLWNRLCFCALIVPGVIVGISPEHLTGREGQPLVTLDPDTDGLVEMDATPVIFIGCGPATPESNAFYNSIQDHFHTFSLGSAYEWFDIELLPPLYPPYAFKVVTSPAPSYSPTVILSLPSPYEGQLTWMLRVRTDLDCFSEAEGLTTITLITRRIGTVHMPDGTLITAVPVGNDVQVYAFPGGLSSREDRALVPNATKPSLARAPDASEIRLMYQDRSDSKWYTLRSLDYGVRFEDFS